MSILDRIFRRTTLVPFNYGQPGCPSLSIGDRIVTILEDDAHDYIAGFCGMDTRIKAGGKRKWRVKEVYGDGDVLLTSGSNRTATKYLTWDDGNRVTVKATLSHSRMRIRFFKAVRARDTQACEAVPEAQADGPNDSERRSSPVAVSGDAPNEPDQQDQNSSI